MALLLSRVRSLSQFHRHSVGLSRQWRRLHAPTYTALELEQSTEDKRKNSFNKLLQVLREPHLRDTLRHPGTDEVQPETLKQLKLAIVRAGFQGDWERSAVLKTLLVSLSPALESIAISPPDLGTLGDSILWQDHSPRPGYFLWDLLESASVSEDFDLYLQNLQTVEFLPDPNSFISDDRYYEALDVDASLDLVRALPSLKKVVFNAVTEEEDDYSGRRPPPQSANYTHIHMKHCLLSYGTHCTAIESSKRLEELVLSIGGRCSLGGWISTVYPNAIFKSLLSHRDSLRHLDLDFEGHVLTDELSDTTGGFTSYEKYGAWEEVDGDEVIEPPKKPLAELLKGKSLREFTEMKHLSIGIHLLYHFAGGVGNDKEVEHTSLADGLPQSLESLRVYGYDKSQQTLMYQVPDLRLDLHIAKFMAEKDTKLPRLKRVEGVEEYIPNGEMVKDPDNNTELLWKRATTE